VQKKLALEKLGVFDNFFALGANSVELVEMHRELRHLFPRDLPIVEIFKNPTISGLAHYLETGVVEAGVLAPAVDLASEAVLEPSIAPKDVVRIKEPPATIFMTGATGFLGGYVLKELLEQTQAQIYCLVRSNSTDDTQDRLRNRVQSLAVSQESSLERIKPVVGDLRQPRFGLTAVEYEDLAGRVDAIYHIGAEVNFVRDYSVLKPSTVIGTTEVLRFAAAVKTKALHHVSSMAVFGSPSYLALGRILESDPLSDGSGLTVGYFQTKWVAERLVMAARERGIPASIYRPPQIAGHSVTGECKVDDLLPLMIRGCIQLGSAPSLGSLPLELMPVDFVSRSIVQLSRNPQLLGKAFNLVSQEPITWDQMFEVIRSSGYAIQQAPYREWLDMLRAAPLENSLLQMLPFFERLDDNLLKSVPIDSENTRQGLNSNPIPYVEPALVIQRCVDYFSRIEFIPRPLPRRAQVV
jgi:thioester reductase-like protein